MANISIGGLFVLYSGAQPATPDDEPEGRLITTIPMVESWGVGASVEDDKARGFGLDGKPGKLLPEPGKLLSGMEAVSETWVYGNRPVDLGWYATTHSWDTNEGMFPGANFWNGEAWVFGNSASTLPIFAFHGPFLSEANAEEWAYAHDIEDHT